MKKYNRLLLFIFFIYNVTCIAQKKKTIKDFEHLKNSTLTKTNTILSQYSQGQMLEWQKGGYYENESFSISDISFLNNSIGDFNKDGIQDIFATMFIKSRSRSETNLGLIQINGDQIEVISYKQFSVGYQEFMFTEFKNDIVKIRAILSGVNGEIFSDRIVSLAYDPINYIKIVSPCKIDDMNNRLIFNANMDVKRNSFINYSMFNEQTEEYKSENIKITAETHGCDDFSLRFTINKENIVLKDFNENSFLLEMISFLKLNTRYPTILTKIENHIKEKNKEKIAISNKMNYDIKNYIEESKYFQIGTSLIDNFYLLDIIYYETN